MANEKITIYLADLTHCTITVSNDAFPLNIGLVGAYAKKCFPDVHIELFKYPQDLKRAIDKKLPDVLGCSNYPWNFELGLSFFKYAKGRDKKVITVIGGPNVSYNKDKQYKMLQGLKGTLDFYALYEGESSFKSLLEAALANDFNVSRMKSAPVAGCLYLDGKGLNEFRPIERQKDLAEFPSPYLAGLMDKFFDNCLSPMIETHRGCPFNCSYCHEGHNGYNRVYRHSPGRVYDEIEYIATRIGKRVKNFMITDPNFGVFKEDISIAGKIREVYERTGYPKTIFASTSKNKKENLVEISKVLSPISMPIWLSVQSMTEKVLREINRKNINVNDMISVQKKLKERNHTSQSELIVCLPAETFETHVDSLAKLIELQIDQIACYQLMLVNGSELESDETARRKHSFSTRFRSLPRSFSDIEGVGRSVEIEEIVTATKDLPFEDYLRARQLHLLVYTYYNCKAFKGFFRLLAEYKLDVKRFIFNLLEAFSSDRQTAEVFNSFIDKTKKELFDSQDRAKTHYSQDENFEKLAKGIVGTNLMFNHAARLYMEKSGFLFGPIKKALSQFLPEDREFQNKLNNISDFYQLSFKDFLAPNRREILTRGCFEYDIAGWLDSQASLDDFRNSERREVIFHTPAQQFEIVESYFARYGRNSQAFGKILTRFWICDMFRKPKYNFIKDTSSACGGLSINLI